MNPPPIVPYHQPNTPPPPVPGSDRPVLQFMTGLVAGTFVSGIVWGISFATINTKSADQGNFALVMMWLLPALKLGAGVTLLCLPGRRLVGGGILTSIAIGFLIFFGFCTLAISKGL